MWYFYAFVSTNLMVCNNYDDFLLFFYTFDLLSNASGVSYSCLCPPSFLTSNRIFVYSTHALIISSLIISVYFVFGLFLGQFPHYSSLSLFITYPNCLNLFFLVLSATTALLSNFLSFLFLTNVFNAHIYVSVLFFVTLICIFSFLLTPILTLN